MSGLPLSAHMSGFCVGLLILLYFFLPDMSDRHVSGCRAQFVSGHVSERVFEGRLTCFWCVRIAVGAYASAPANPPTGGGSLVVRIPRNLKLCRWQWFRFNGHALRNARAF